MKTNWKEKALKVHEMGLISQRGLARALMVPKSTLNDFIRKQREKGVE